MTRMLVTLACLTTLALGSASTGSASPSFGPSPRGWGVGHANPRITWGLVVPNPTSPGVVPSSRIGWVVSPRISWGFSPVHPEVLFKVRNRARIAP
jgi:hypothetical protein